MIEGTKDRIPAMNNAVLKFINKYHTAHFGFDLNHGSIKLKNTVSNVIERAYHEAPMSFKTLQSSVKHLRNQRKDKYRKAPDSLLSMNEQDVIDRLAGDIRKALKHSEEQIYVMLEAVPQLLSDTKFTVPGSEEKLSSLEMLRQARWSVSRATERAIQRFASLMEKIFSLIRGIDFTLPVINVDVNGIEIMNNLKLSTRSVYDQLQQLLRRGLRYLHKTVNDLFQVFAEKGRNVITYLKDRNYIISQVDIIYAEIVHSSNQHIREAKRHMAEYKDHTKLKIQEAYYALSLECVNNNTKEFISILQSHFYGGLNKSIDLMRRASQSTAPYIRMSNNKTDVEIPLPFLWKSFSERPMQSRQ